MPRWFSQNFDFGDRFFRLAAINVLSNLMVPLAGLADVAFLGHLSDLRYLTGVTLATVIFNYLYWTFGFLRMGTTGMTAQAVGRGDSDEIWLTGLRHGAVALAVGCLILVLQQPIANLGFALLNAAPEVKQAGQAYFHAQIWGAPATLINFVLMGWFLGRERGRRVLVLSAIANGVDVSLNYLFIVRFGWASMGAGAATAISQYAMLTTGVWFVAQEWNSQHIRSLTPKLFNVEALKGVLSLNSNITIRTFVLISAFAAFTNLSAAFGTLTLATNTLILQVLTLASYFIDGFAFATESFAGMFRGGGDRSRLTALVKLSGGASLALGLAIALMFSLFPVPLFRLLTNHDAVLQNITSYVAWLIPILGFGSIAYMLDGYFLGLTAGRTLRNAALISVLVGFAPMAIGSWLLHQEQGLWLALTGFMLARALSLGIRLPQTFRERG